MTAGERLEPYTASSGDLCGRCTSQESPITVRHHYISGWIINLCESCLTPEEVKALKGTMDDSLYLSGVR